MARSKIKLCGVSGVTRSKTVLGAHGTLVSENVLKLGRRKAARARFRLLGHAEGKTGVVRSTQVARGVCGEVKSSRHTDRRAYTMAVRIARAGKPNLLQ